MKEKIKNWWKKNWVTVTEYGVGAVLGLALAGAINAVCKHEDPVQVIDCGELGYFVTDTDHFAEAFAALYSGMQ